MGSPVVKHKSMSKSVSKSVKIFDVESPAKKGKDLKIIKEVVKKKKEDKK